MIFNKNIVFFLRRAILRAVPRRGVEVMLGNMIEAFLKSRIEAVYPKGVDWERDNGQLDPHDHVGRIQSAIGAICAEAPLAVTAQRWSSPCDEFAFTSALDPEFDTWIWSMGNAAKINWIREHDKPYVVLWIKVSRVAGYYVTHFNHWRPRGDTGYLDADFREQPNAAWQEFSGKVFAHLKAAGFELATSTMLQERVPFVLTWGGDEIPDDDPRWGNNDFEPDPVPASVYDCLFGDQ